MLVGCASKPVPFTTSALAYNARANFDKISMDQETLSEPLDLYKSMARAIKYNLDYRLATAEAKLGNAKLNLSHYSMLPNIAANAGYAARNNDQASSSLNLLTNKKNFAASTSQDKAINTADLSFSWNILDFGLSYVRSRQAADKYLIKQEMKRKVLHKLMDDVRNTYWRAISYQRLVKRLRVIKSRTQKAYVNTRALSESGETSRITALISERELLKIKRAIEDIQRDMITAKSKLAALIGIKPGIAFEIISTPRKNLHARLPFTLEEMMVTALRDRAELRENLYQKRIHKHEAKAVLLEMLPGLKLYAGPNASSNSFLLNSNWISWGATASWNLLRVFQYPANRYVLKKQDAVLEAQALALSMAVMTQVHISRIRYHQLRRQRDTADKYRSVQNRLVRQYRKEAQASRISEQVLLSEEMNTLVAEAKYDIADSELQSAYANLFASIGQDPYVTVDPSFTVNDIASQLKDSWFETGRMDIGKIRNLKRLTIAHNSAENG